ncbi:flagella synthesis protein FlgN [Massilia genomosp. 1]|uniref:Flagellar protein FlgN n=1 Tax=Massilia genomosp. 1 TaxID=2609280 RepID=A0ABX0MK78_9BURK|nr:flagellar protein FlgN [Massilia genomosp. 1]NHZ61000.1 flagellar protein FlgN [Massilia genomosp. 1]
MSTATPSTTLPQELALITSVLELMTQEQQLLVSADTAGLDQLTPRKAQAVLEMTTLAQQRHAHLAAAGFAADEGGMQAWMNRHGAADALSSWQALLDKTREAKELNRINGMLITKQLSHTKGLINAMRTPTSGGEAGVYGKSGQAAPGGPSKRYVVG